jgi:hypothetical protein
MHKSTNYIKMSVFIHVSALPLSYFTLRETGDQGRRTRQAEAGSDEARFWQPPSWLLPMRSGSVQVVNITGNEIGGSTYVLGPVTMRSGHGNTHISKVRNLLALETVKVGLNRRRSVFKVLSRGLQRIFQLQPTISSQSKEQTGLPT